jgi:hypothetical protein
MAVPGNSWKILQLTPATGWVARSQNRAGELVEEALAGWALVDTGAETLMVGMVAGNEEAACNYAARREGYVGCFYRGIEVPLAAALPAVQKAVKAGSSWKSTKPDH